MVDALKCIAVIAFATCAGCALVEPLNGDSPPATRLFSFRDGGVAIYYTLDKGSPARSGEPDTYVFVVSGSECRSMKAWLPRYFRGLDGASGSMRIFVVHKRHVEERSPADARPCSEAFTRSDHAGRWISDYLEFAESRLAGSRPRRVVLVGISEGGEVVPALARRLAGVSHVILLASGGMDPLEAFVMQAKRFQLPGWQAVVAAAFGPAPADPDAPRDDLGGRSWRYWAELRGLEPASTLLALEIPILLAMGEQDQSVPPESAWLMRERFAARGKTNLTLLSFDGADHALFDHERGVSRLPEFWRMVDAWLSLDTRKSEAISNR